MNLRIVGLSKKDLLWLLVLLLPGGFFLFALWLLFKADYQVWFGKKIIGRSKDKDQKE